MNKKKRKILTIVSISVLLIMLIGTTYAFFRTQGGSSTSRDVSVTSNTTDNLSFSISNDITFTVTQADLAEGGNNKGGNATATAILTPNNKTGSATMNYYMYLNLIENGIDYSSTNTNHNPELMVQVFDGNNELVSLTGLGAQKTIKGVTGYDITGKLGLIPLLVNHEITASGYTATTENWQVVITMINLDVDQNDNTNKEVNGEILIQKDQTNLVQNNIAQVMDAYNLTEPESVTLSNGYLYYHDERLTNGANDGSYRYAGANPNNYVCFGSDETVCPADNLYRIIGLIPVDVIVDESDPNNVITERQTLYKLIKNDYETTSSLDMSKAADINVTNPYNGVAGNQPSSSAGAFYWSGSSSNQNNTWSLSTLNTKGLNTTVLTNLGKYAYNIAKVNWKVGGNSSTNIYSVTPMSSVYANEIVNPLTSGSSDGAPEYAAKIGLLYISDYGYAAPQSYWTYPVYDSSQSSNQSDYRLSSILSNNWIYRGIVEYTITRAAGNTSGAFGIDALGFVGEAIPYTHALAVRRVFYLNQYTTIDMTAHAGTSSDPYRISNTYNYCSINPTDDICLDVPTKFASLSSSIATSNVAISGNGYLYRHDSLLTNGADDTSYRYAGTNPNNYICFGSSESTCPAENMYRIIGLIPVDVVTDDTDPNNIVTERQTLYKLIKNDYETTSSIGLSSPYNPTRASNFTGPSGNQPSETVVGFYWKGNVSNNYNTWSLSTLNTTGLNLNIYYGFTPTWQEKIAKVMWKVGGNSYATVAAISPIKGTYTNEILNPTTINSQDNLTEYAANVGLVYVSDYTYAVPESLWNYPGYSGDGKDYRLAIVTGNNWLYKGIREWTITRDSDENGTVFWFDNIGNVGAAVLTYSCAVRRVFYLTSDTSIDMTNHVGTYADPYRIANSSNYCSLNSNAQMCNAVNNTFTSIDSTDVLSENVAVSGNGYLYYHNSTLTNGANDGGYRYAGTNPNNYICFGSTDASCPSDNLYRIIGKVPVNVVVNEQTGARQQQMLYKIIKNDYETSTSLGMTAKDSSVDKTGSYAGPSGNQPNGSVQGFYWKGTYSNNYNTWSLSTLNTTGLNTNAYGTFSSTWQEKIAKVAWKVGGNERDIISLETPMSSVYTNEITNPVATSSQDNAIDYVAKIGLMYVTDYGYAAPQFAWTTAPYYYNNSSIRATNWLYKGVNEWILTRNNTLVNCSYFITYDGICDGDYIYNARAVRRTFYLTNNTQIDMTNYAGTKTDPYRII